jgi:hypothetical protein
MLNVPDFSLKEIAGDHDVVRHGVCELSTALTFLQIIDSLFLHFVYFI